MTLKVCGIKKLQCSLLAASSTHCILTTERYKPSGMLSSKCSDSEIEAFKIQIRQGAFDGQEFIPAGNKKLVPDHAQQIRTEVETRNR